MQIKKHIPNFITTLNLVCGMVGVVFAFQARPDIAFLLMLAASVFDFCDGFAARLLGAYSPMGKELDSMCDMVSFGVLPALMLHANMKVFVSGACPVCYFMPLVFAVGVALRLANFNIDTRQSHGFIGLACPVAALLCGALCYYAEFEPNSFVGVLCASPYFMPALSVVLVLLMLCQVPMFAFKFSKDDEPQLKKQRLWFLGDCVVVILGVLLVGTNWSIIIVLCALLYIFKNFVFFVSLRRKKIK